MCWFYDENPIPTNGSPPKLPMWKKFSPAKQCELEWWYNETQREQHDSCKQGTPVSSMLRHRVA